MLSIDFKSSFEFCNSCQTNQLIVNRLMAEYLPDEDNPEYDKLYNDSHIYRDILERKYPTSCKNCQKSVNRILAEQQSEIKINQFQQALNRTKIKKKKIYSPSNTKTIWASIMTRMFSSIKQEFDSIFNEEHQTFSIKPTFKRIDHFAFWVLNFSWILFMTISVWLSYILDGLPSSFQISSSNHFKQLELLYPFIKLLELVKSHSNILGLERNQYLYTLEVALFVPFLNCILVIIGTIFMVKWNIYWPLLALDSSRTLRRLSNYKKWILALAVYRLVYKVFLKQVFYLIPIELRPYIGILFFFIDFTILIGAVLNLRLSSSLPLNIRLHDTVKYQEQDVSSFEIDQTSSNENIIQKDSWLKSNYQSTGLGGVGIDSLSIGRSNKKLNSISNYNYKQKDNFYGIGWKSHASHSHSLDSGANNSISTKLTNYCGFENDDGYRKNENFNQAKDIVDRYLSFDDSKGIDEMESSGTVEALQDLNSLGKSKEIIKSESTEYKVNKTFLPGISKIRDFSGNLKNESSFDNIRNRMDKNKGLFNLNLENNLENYRISFFFFLNYVLLWLISIILIKNDDTSTMAKQEEIRSVQANNLNLQKKPEKIHQNSKQKFGYIIGIFLLISPIIPTIVLYSYRSQGDLLGIDHELVISNGENQFYYSDDRNKDVKTNNNFENHLFIKNSENVENSNPLLKKLIDANPVNFVNEPKANNKKENFKKNGGNDNFSFDNNPNSESNINNGNIDRNEENERKIINQEKKYTSYSDTFHQKRSILELKIRISITSNSMVRNWVAFKRYLYQSIFGNNNLVLCDIGDVAFPYSCLPPSSLLIIVLYSELCILFISVLVPIYQFTFL
ncbi:hypothetical protein BB558_003060 [Smittium angustum]|uniref:Ima1 N-terminal domain-containing protein n=1 Tax=Smittium angustum TaxID=133377 RepID=A0A2U1J6Z3_SMIAN|nr:hypothetical protein BB558_003060 [Smittium angustum]